MKDSRDRRAKEIMAEIHDVLWYDWDPIGINDVAPDDEYDSYIDGVYRLLTAQCDRKAIVKHLALIELDTMGLGSVKTGVESEHNMRLELIAEKLLSIDVSMKQG